MELLGFCGIIKLTIQFILRNFHELPCAFNFIILGPFFQTLEASISFLHSLCLPNVLSIFSIITSSLCLLLVAFSVCRACINKSLDLKGSLRGVRRSVITLGLTALFVVAVLFTFILVATVVMVIIGVGLSAVNVNLATPMIIMAMGAIYAVALSLPNIVAILEEKGWEAMRRSMYLMKGSKGTAILGLCIFYGLLSTVLLFVVCVSEDALKVWGWVGGMSVGLQAMVALVALCSMVSHVVLYMSCKSLLVDPLDVQFGPPQLAAKYVDLEAAAFPTPTH